MTRLYMFVRIDGERLALSADAIDSVIEFDAVTPVPRAPGHVIGLAALRSRVVTMIDVRAAIGLPAHPVRTAAEAVIFAHDGQYYGLAVDAVDDVAPGGAPLPLRAPPAGGWGEIATGLLEHDGALLLLIDPVAVIVPRVPAAA